MEKQTIHRPLVGIGVIIERNGKILIGERTNSHGAGSFQIPGGHLEFGESFEDCAKREAGEETGLNDIVIKKIISVGNDIAYGKHYVSIGMLAESLAGEPTNPEPEKSCAWQWYEPKDIPENMFLHSKKVIKHWLNGTFY